ncbi:hypothetical protein M413DRAFT_448151 [Hebeloma cylindrosporum]|uniref:DUF6534 domain-containing protein n=1 Tax=Hebeloma cylindrosporum TaxID=76867 RepID=A0A0C3C2N1_HEBCY|nr:hypothetical protein M413DRAFT_448151 [Hebeloma cylindrosporum h7]
MNITSSATANTNTTFEDLHTTLAAVFYGFSVGAILFGITIRQAYQYYTSPSNDPIVQKLVIGLVCLLDAFHLAFSMYLVYSFILQAAGFSQASGNVLWSLKALGSTQVFLIILVQGFYLSQIWRLSGNLLLPRKFSLAIQIFVVFIALFALAVAVIFFTQLQKIDVVHSFSTDFVYMVYLGFGSTAIIDCAIATAMCLLLYRSSAGTIKSETVLETLIQYFIGSGLLTSFAAIMCIVLYVAQPNTLLYLGMEFSVTRLYANSLLAMSNARRHLRDRLDETMELRLPNNLFFTEPDQMTQQHVSLMENPFSPGAETKYSKECEFCSHQVKYRKSGGTVSSRGYTV